MHRRDLAERGRTDIDIDIDALARAIDPRTLSTADFVQLAEVSAMLIRTGSIEDLRAVSTASLVRLVSRASRAQLDAATNRPEPRALVLTEFFRRLPEHLRADRVDGMTGVIRWRLTGGAKDDGYDRFQMINADGRCTVGDELDREPDVTLTVAPADFRTLATTALSAPLMLATRRVAVHGDLRLVVRLLRCFDVPKG